MRPVKLEIAGFTAFREMSIVDFTRLDLFAITGPTGAGKTSLLDAITYALYGKTARLSKAGKELVSQGATAMSVVFEFSVGARSYRVARAIRGANSTVRLETLENGTWKPGAGRITDANAEIEKLIGLDFGGFTKTVILPQGQFDVFLRGDPKERRAVLAELLDVKIYGQMAASANSKSKDAQIRVEERERGIDLQATEEAKTEAEASLSALRERHREADGRGAVLRKALPQALELREQTRALHDNEARRETASANAARLRETIAGTLTALETENQHIAEWTAQLASIAYDSAEHLRVSALLPKTRQLEQIRTELSAEQSRLAKSGNQLASAEKKVEEAGAALATADGALQQAESSANESERTLAALREQFGSADKIRLLLDEIARVESELPASVREEEELRQLESRAGTLDAEIGAAAIQVEQADAALEQLNAVHAGASLRLGLKKGEACPVCEQTVQEPPAPPASTQAKLKGAKLARDRAAQKLNGLEIESAQLPDRIARMKQSLTARKQRIASLESRLPAGGLDAAKAALLAAIEQSAHAERAALGSRKQLEHARAGQARAESAAQQARHARELVEADIRRSAQRVAALDQQWESLSAELGDRTDAAAMAALLSALEQALEQRNTIEARLRQHEDRRQRAERDAESKRQELAALEASLAALGEAIERLTADIARLESSLREAVAESDASRIEALEQANRRELDSLNLEIQRTELSIAGLVTRIERNAKLREEVEALREDASIYHDLGVWLNAGNFQQYLLKSAYTILTKEGSRHLSQLSGGRYEFVYEDDEFAVMDHANADDTRSVRTLSGGESFLASLSLALALAESITQLSGARGAVNLESLFLDEGFSTLDPETLGKVADALEVLHGGHRMVGIITHVASLAEQMPARIEILKGAGGSRILQDTGLELAATATP